MKLRTLIPVLTLVGIVNGCQSASEAQGNHPVQTSVTAPGMEQRTPCGRAWAPICLTANNLSIATGQPSLVLMSSGATHIPMWSLSGSTVGQSVAGLVTGLPSGCAAVKVEIVVTTTDAATSPIYEDVYRVHLSQMVEDAAFTSRYVLGKPVRTALPTAPFHTRTIVLESYYPVEPNAPLSVRVQREPADPADSFTHPTGLAMVKVTPLDALAKPYVVQNVHGYNSWPMIQAIGEKLVCVYSRGTAHSIGEDVRAVYARTSADNGKTWTAETVVANTPHYGEVEVGKGLDAKGAMLLWVRRIGKDWNHDLYRTTDGVKFEKISTPALSPLPVQITDIFHVPGTGMMSLWFAGAYDSDSAHSWGTLVSADNGRTWTQKTVEKDLSKADWPTEQAAAYVGDGKILAIARTEITGSSGGVQFQLTSADCGATWKRERTNISDIMCSTPSLVYDAQSGLVSNYYFERGKGLVKRRVNAVGEVWSAPTGWAEPEIVGVGSERPWDTGNVNATVIGRTHFIAYYSGTNPDTAVFALPVLAPGRGK